MSRSRIEGADAVIELLKTKAPNVARNLLRATVHGFAGVIAKDVKDNAPKLTGELKKSIKVKRLKAKGRSRNFVASGVAINARTPPSKKRPDGAFLWVHVEYGTQDAAEHPFVRPAKQRAHANANEIFKTQFGKKLEKQLAREARGPR